MGYSEVGCDILNVDEDRQMELLLAENTFREKTTIQKVSEADLLKKSLPSNVDYILSG